ncbi:MULTISPECIES: fasciclin domain-containing protein [Leifsonia]|uniref:Putative surface protein with fasciclin (FAS1) repeats n=1 Tax=Leifsonia naganoensis TaxID=150025 RepID=A0A853DR14_9MICO|nr:MULTISPECIES: fasciclin domain-containing protein [Leifsonia]NYK10063.1 putative surface protein with fasciclin (FAS1) repeats [Leifsonia naganoensis]
MRTSKISLAVAGTVAALALALTGCSSGSGTGSSSTSSSGSSMTTPSSSAMADPAADLVGPGCAAYAKQVPSGAGSVAGMSQDPVATAASNNPLLTTLVAAVSGKLNPKVNLVDTLNGGEFTVFAPVDSAFAKIDAATLDTLKTDAGADTLSKILTYHVVQGQIAPTDIDGTHKTVEGGDLTVTGSGDSMKVNDASVICGGVHTANATVYLIDSVLMPPAQ